MIDRSLKRLSKKSRRGFRGYPVATIAAYGPDDRRASKLAVAIVRGEDEDSSEMRRVVFRYRGRAPRSPSSGGSVSVHRGERCVLGCNERRYHRLPA